LSRRVDLSRKVLAPFVRAHNLNRVGGGRWPVKTLPESFTNYAS
jgi:hypothetical protein